MAATSVESPVIIVAPVGQDAPMMAALLDAEAIPNCVYESFEQCADHSISQAGALLLTEEAFELPQLQVLTEALKAQPTWSEMPIIVLVGAGENRLARLISALAAAPGTVTVLERPMHSTTLLHAVAVAIRSRRRQYQVRDLLDSERYARGEAERVGRLKDEFLATLSHELRTPLNAILGWGKLVEKNLSDAKLAREGVQVIIRNAQVQADLVSDLLDMNRIISGKIRLEFKKVDLSDIVQAAVDAVRPAADAKQISLHSFTRPSACPVRVDPSRIQQVVWNLLTNAIKFTPRGGTVHVRLLVGNSSCQVHVSDTGKGIEPEFLPYVFDRFRQADASTTREHGGLGLGLAIVKQLVELHGGQVWADSAGPGQGSTFTVEIPLCAAESGVDAATDDSRLVFAGESGSPASSSIDLSGIHVIAVDDQPDARNLLKRMLEDQGADVRTAGSAKEALALLAAGVADLILCDISMPGMDGYQFIRQVRAQGDRVPAVALTAYARSEDRTRAILAGFQGHLTKPIEPTELVATVAYLARAQAAPRDVEAAVRQR